MGRYALLITYHLGRLFFFSLQNGEVSYRTRKVLKEHSADGKLPSMKLLKAEKERLLQKKKEAQNKYHYYRDYQKELLTVCSNVNMILGQPHSRQPEKQKSTDIS